MGDHLELIEETDERVVEVSYNLNLSESHGNIISFSHFCNVLCLLPYFVHIHTVLLI